MAASVLAYLVFYFVPIHDLRVPRAVAVLDVLRDEQLQTHALNPVRFSFLSSFVSNVPTWDRSSIMTTVDTPDDSTLEAAVPAQSMVLVPRDTPGFRIGKVFNKSGWRFYQNAELIFENAEVPAPRYMAKAGVGWRALGRSEHPFPIERLVRYQTMYVETGRYLQRRFPRDMRSLCEVLDTLDDRDVLDEAAVGVVIDRR